MPIITAKTESEVEVEVEVYCTKCGAGLCNQASGGNGRRGAGRLDVEPCQNCLGVAESKGYEDGLSDASLSIGTVNCGGNQCLLTN